MEQCLLGSVERLVERSRYRGEKNKLPIAINFAVRVYLLGMTQSRAPF